MARIRKRAAGVYEITVATGIKDPRTGRYGQVSRIMRLDKPSSGDAIPRIVQRFANQLESEVNAGKHQAERHTVTELLERYIRQQEVKKAAPKTVLENRRRAKQIAADTLGSKDIRKLTAFDLDEFYLRLSERDLSSTTIHHYHALLRAALNQGVKWGWLGAPSPAKDAEAPKARPEVRDPPTPAQARHLWEAVIEANPDLARLIYFDGATGMRRGEICGLRFCDINWARAELTVNQRISDLPGEVRVLADTKNKKRRTFAIDPFALDVLDAQREQAEKRCTSLGIPLAADAYVWSQEPDHSEPWRPNRISDTFRRLRDTEGLGHVRFNDLRHMNATQLLADGIDPRTVAGRLGHDPSVMFRTYAHRVPARDRDAATRGGTIFGGFLPPDDNDGQS